MLANTSKAVVRRQTSYQFLSTGLLTQGPQLFERLLERLHPLRQEGDPEPSLKDLPHSLVQLLNNTLENTVTADEAVFKADAHLHDLRKERDEAAQRLRRVEVLFRQTLAGRYREPRLGALGFDAHTPEQPMHLLRQADRVTEIFAGDDLDTLLGEPYVAGQEPPYTILQETKERAEELRVILRTIDEELRKRDAGMVARNRQLAEYDLRYIYSARIFEAFCRLAGESELAERVRRSVRRNRRAPAESEEEAGGEDPVEGSVDEEGPETSASLIASV